MYHNKIIEQDYPEKKDNSIDKLNTNKKSRQLLEDVLCNEFNKYPCKKCIYKLLARERKRHVLPLVYSILATLIDTLKFDNIRLDYIYKNYDKIKTNIGFILLMIAILILK